MKSEISKLRNRKITILIVDDDDSVRRVLVEYFDSKGFVAFAASRAEEALAIFSEEQNAAWLGQVRQQIAIALLQEESRANLTEARYHIDSALYFCREHHSRAYPSALNRAGRIYAQECRYDRALEFFDESIRQAQSIQDHWFLIEVANTGEDEFLLALQDSIAPGSRARPFGVVHGGFRMVARFCGPFLRREVYGATKRDAIGLRKALPSAWALLTNRLAPVTAKGSIPGSTSHRSGGFLWIGASFTRGAVCMGGF